MTLKEAFQAQNKINSIIRHIERYISDDDNIMNVTEKHLRSKALDGQADETLKIIANDEEKFDVMGLLKVWEKLLKEKELLGQAISKAKSQIDFNLDIEVDINKNRHIFITILQKMAMKKSYNELKKGAGTGYVFNNEGNQTPYHYDVDYVYTIDYDRNYVRTLLKRVQREAEACSLQIEEVMVTTKVDHELSFDLTSDNSLLLEELLEQA